MGEMNMFRDEKQIEKSKSRRTTVKEFIKDKNIDEKSFTYFMDIVDDLALCLDLRLGYIEKIMTLMSDTYDKLNSLS